MPKAGFTSLTIQDDIFVKVKLYRDQLMAHKKNIELQKILETIPDLEN